MSSSQLNSRHAAIVYAEDYKVIHSNCGTDPGSPKTLPQCKFQFDLIKRHKCVKNQGLFVVLDEGTHHTVIKCNSTNPIHVEVATETGKFLSYSDNEKFVVIHEGWIDTKTSEQIHSVTIPIIHESANTLHWSSPILKYTVRNAQTSENKHTTEDIHEPPAIEYMVLYETKPVIFSVGNRKPPVQSDIVYIPCLYDYTSNTSAIIYRENKKEDILHSMIYNPFRGFGFNISTQPDLYVDQELTCHGVTTQSDVNAGISAQLTKGYGIEFRTGLSIFPNDTKLECYTPPCKIYCEFEEPIHAIISTSSKKPQVIPGKLLFETFDKVRRYAVEYFGNSSSKLNTVQCIRTRDDHALHTWNILHFNVKKSDKEQTLRIICPSETGFPKALQCISKSKGNLTLISLPCNNTLECDYYSRCIHEEKSVENWQHSFKVPKTCSDLASYGSNCQNRRISENCKELDLPRFGSGKLFCFEENGVMYEANYLIGLIGTLILNPTKSTALESSALVKITFDHEGDIYTELAYWFTCESHKFYTEHGLQWMLKWKNGSLTTPKIYEEIEYNEIWTSGTNPKRKSRIIISGTDIDAVVCNASMIDGSEPKTAEFPLPEIKERVKPVFDLPSKVVFTIDEHENLECVADGMPPPTVHWELDENQKHNNTHVEATGPCSSRLKFSKCKEPNAGNYTCVAMQGQLRTVKRVYIAVEPKFPHIAIVVGTATILITLAVIVTVWISTKRMAEEKTAITDEAFDDFMNGIQNYDCQDEDCFLIPALVLPYDNSYEIEKKYIEFDTSEYLGTGEFGKVYKAMVIKREGAKQIKIQSAVKTPKLTSGREKEIITNFLCEIKLMMYIGKHPNLVEMIGACTKNCRNGEVYLALEYCDHGSLRDHVRNLRERFSVVSVSSSEIEANVYLSTDELEMACRSRNVSSCSTEQEYANWPNGIDEEQLNEFIQWSYEISCGMEYIARKRLIQGDIALRNILLQSQGNRLVAKISDFGLSRKLYEYAQFVQAKQDVLPWRHLSPEALRYLKFSIKSDVWAYGICLWELFTLGDVPYSGISHSMEFVNMLDAGLRNPKPRFANDRLYRLMKRCWQPQPEQRPRFADIKQFFETEYGSGALAVVRNSVEMESVQL